MKKLVTLFLALALAAGAFVFPALAAQAQPLDILSDAVALIDADTGQLLYGKNADERMYPASMTKIMTALLVVELCEPDEVITVTESALEIEEPDSSNIKLQPGEQLTVEQALYGLMLPSGNDAANVLAEHAAGSTGEFTRLMTERAHEIGAVNTSFTNAHGLHEDSHYTTARDMALITAHAAQNEQFMKYFSALRYEMPPTNLTAERSFSNSQSMLDPNSNYYNADVVGGKTGFTYEAMYTLSSYASRDARNLVTVVMHGEVRADTFDDTRTLLSFGFNRFYPVRIAGGRFSGFQVAIQEADDEGALRAVGSVSYEAEPDFTALLHNDIEPDQIEIVYSLPDTLTRESDYDCRVEFRIPGVVPGVPAVLGAVELEPSVFLPHIRVVEEGFSLAELLKLLGKDLLLIVMVLAGIVVLALLFAVALRQHRLKKRRRNRQRRLREQAGQPQAPVVRYERQIPAAAQAVRTGGARPQRPAQSARRRQATRPGGAKR